VSAIVPARHFENDGEAFEQRGKLNGGKYWLARHVMEMLGYDDFSHFESTVINRALGTCMTLGIPVIENFQQVAGDGGLPDMKLSRFACYLVAMNGNVQKPQVAAAQAYFATLAVTAQQYVQDANDIERVQIRSEISEREKNLASTAKQAGVEQYALFQNAGYRGMYNMDLNQLKKVKGLPKLDKPLLDFMDKRELAGNLFRITETEAKLKRDETRGQGPAEKVAYTVGKKVRDIMIENTGERPEYIPLAGDIAKVKKGLKQTVKEFLRLDRPKKG
jgi:DNA-damage-inducible protein D